MDYGDSIGIAQIASSAIQTAGSLLNSTFGYKQTKELAEYQNDMNRQNWEMQNEYNLPVNQVKRLEDAGINPVLAYQNSADASNASPMQPAQVGKPFQLDMSVLGNALNSVFDAFYKKKELQMLDKQIDAQEIRNRMSAIGLKKSALDFIFGYESPDPERDGFDVYGLAGGIPDTISPDYNSIAFQRESGSLGQLLGMLNLLGSRKNLTDAQVNYYNKMLDKLEADINFTESRTIGQGYDNDISEVNAAFAELGKLLGIGEQGTRILKLIMRFFR